VDRLWAPWRSQFIYGQKPHRCIFCRAVTSKKDAKHYVFRRSRHAFAILNIYPYNNGHVMVAPRKHIASLQSCSDAALLDIWRMVHQVQAQVERALQPRGFNIGLNVGRVGGAGIPGHAHVHIVPRWPGDTNFMPVLSDTKIISDSLDEVYARLTTSRTRGATQRSAR
jgi:ATP adenylyltransferase